MYKIQPIIKLKNMKLKNCLLYLFTFLSFLSYGQTNKELTEEEKVLSIKKHLISQIQKETFRRNDDPSLLPSDGYQVSIYGNTYIFDINFSYIRDEQNRIKSAIFYDTVNLTLDKKIRNYYKVDIDYNINGFISNVYFFGFLDDGYYLSTKDSFGYHSVYTDHQTAYYSYKVSIFDGEHVLMNGDRNRIIIDSKNNIKEIIHENYKGNVSNPSWLTYKSTKAYYMNDNIDSVVDTYYTPSRKLSYEEKYSFMYNQDKISGFVIQNRSHRHWLEDDDYVFWENKIKIEDIDYENYKFDYTNVFLLKVFKSYYSETYPYSFTIYDLFKNYQNTAFNLNRLHTYIGFKSYKEYTWSDDIWLNKSKMEIKKNTSNIEYLVSSWDSSILDYVISKRYIFVKFLDKTQVIIQYYQDGEWINIVKYISYPKRELLGVGTIVFPNDYPYSNYYWSDDDWKLNNEWKIELVKDEQTGIHLYLIKSQSYLDEFGIKTNNYQKLIYTKWGPKNTNINIVNKSELPLIYPNPCFDGILIQLPLSNKVSNVIISDINGKDIYQCQIDSISHFIDFNKFKSGVYFIKIDNGIQYNTQKILKY